MPQDDSRAQAEAALNNANKAARRGDFKEAERWSKVAALMAASAEKLAPPPPQESLEEEEAARAKFREGMLRFVDADIEWRVWEFEVYVHKLYSERAAREGLPPAPPLREAPPCEGNIHAFLGPRDEKDRSIAAMVARAIERQTIDYLKAKMATPPPAPPSLA